MSLLSRGRIIVVGPSKPESKKEKEARIKRMKELVESAFGSRRKDKNIKKGVF